MSVFGAAMDILVRYGGTAILSETPEIGVEHTLTCRAAMRLTPYGFAIAFRFQASHARPRPYPSRASILRASSGSR